MKRLYCRLMHRGAMLPFRGKYRCPRCLTEFECCWDRPEKQIDEPVQSVQSLKEGETTA